MTKSDFLEHCIDELFLYRGKGKRVFKVKQVNTAVFDLIQIIKGRSVFRGTILISSAYESFVVLDLHISATNPLTGKNCSAVISFYPSDMVFIAKAENEAA